MHQEPPRHRTAEELIEELKRVAFANVAGSQQLLGRVGTLLVQVGEAVKAAPLGGVPDVTSVSLQALDAALAASAIVSEHTLSALNQLVSVAERTLDAARQTAAGASVAEEPPTVVRIEGRRGERAVGRFAVDNQYDCPVNVSFSAGPLTSGVLAPIPGSRIALQPPHPAIGPRASQIVEAAVDLTDEFAAGQTYTSWIRIVGFQAPDIRLDVVVLPPADRTHRNVAAATAKPRRKTSRKRNPK